LFNPRAPASLHPSPAPRCSSAPNAKAPPPLARSVRPTRQHTPSRRSSSRPRSCASPAQTRRFNTTAENGGAHVHHQQRRKQKEVRTEHDEKRDEHGSVNGGAIRAQDAGWLVQRAPPIDGEMHDRQVDAARQAEDRRQPRGFLVVFNRAP